MEEGHLHFGLAGQTDSSQILPQDCPALCSFTGVSGETTDHSHHCSVCSLDILCGLFLAGCRGAVHQRRPDQGCHRHVHAGWALGTGSQGRVTSQSFCEPQPLVRCLLHQEVAVSCAPIPDQPVLFQMCMQDCSVASKKSVPNIPILISQPHNAQMASPRAGPVCFVAVTSDCPFFAEPVAQIPLCQMGRKDVFPFSVPSCVRKLLFISALCVPLAAGTQMHEPGGGECAVHNPGPGDGETGQVQRSREVSFFQFWCQSKTEPEKLAVVRRIWDWGLGWSEELSPHT